LGWDLDGEAAGDYFGGSVAINGAGDRVAVGASLNDGGPGNNGGHVRVFERDQICSLPQNITVTSPEDGTFIYPNSSFCSADSDPTPTISGTSGGVFSSTSGLVINASTGVIDLSGSTLGTYTVSYLTSISSCSATGTFDVTITGSAAVDAGADQTLCAGSSVTLSGSGATTYVWDNGISNATAFTPTATTTYTVTGTDANNCTATDQVTITINNSNTGTGVKTACDSYTWIDGNTYTTSNNTATHLLTNAAGCDSVVTLDLTINNSTTGTDVETACESFTWIDGNTYTTSNNTATHLLTNAAGCDSTVTLD
jgi:hypothetical protein